MRRIARLSAAIGLLWFAALSASAQYPTKSVRIIVPAPPGGLLDTVARTVGQPLSQRLGQPVILENRPGAEGVVGGQVAATSAPDGYTLVMGSGGNIAAVRALRKNPPYDPVADFTPISFLGKIAFFLFVHPSVPVQTLSELIDYARANPGKLNYGTGNASAIVFTAQFMSIAKLDMVHVPYKGEAPAMTDFLTGRVQLMFATATNAVPQAKEGRLRALVTLLDARSSLLPDVPTVAEARMPNLSLAGWLALFGPAKMPRDVTERLSREVNAVLEHPGVREQLDRQGFEPKGSTPEELAAYVKEQIDAYSRAARAAGIEPE
jgi:tripartite-type tricarboxylate transporter receptor subunit TctC